MADRRMFSRKITNSARFLKMPEGSQTLYFHLGMHADDDGVVEAFSVMRSVGSNEDNLKVLASKGFVKILNDDLVAYIMDWREHNLIRADRKVDSIYKDLLLQIVPELELLPAKPRADTGKPSGRPADDQGTPDGPHRLGEDRRGKDSIGKDRKGNKGTPIPPNSIDEVLNYIKNNNLNVDGPSWYKFFEAGNWYDSKGNPVISWKQKLLTYHRQGWMPIQGKKKSMYRNLDND